jgi:hypothetical protein
MREFGSALNALLWGACRIEFFRGNGLRGLSVFAVATKP